MITTMGKQPVIIVLLSCCLLAVAAAAAAAAAAPSSAAGHDEEADEGMSTYIVHVMPAHAPLRGARVRLARTHYSSFVRELLPPHIARPAPRLLYSYAHAMTGFAARLTAQQAAHLAAQPSIAAVVRGTVYKLHTTLSSTFLHLSPSSGLQAESNGATDAVIAVLDTGIYPKDRASFAPLPSLPPTPPPTFRGGCVSGPNFDARVYCNNKLVGAKMFYRGYEFAKGPMNETVESKSPLDTDGHGTHCASIAAGSPVPDANLLGFATGVAKGTAPAARIAVYKVCWKGGCFTADIVAAIDAAIADGVDVISMSLGAVQKTLLDPEAIASFNAARQGIVVVAAAGNDGPGGSTLSNVPPWMLTVGSSSMNRQFPAIVVLGDGQTFVGSSLYPGDPHSFMKSLILADSAGSAYCEIGKLDASKVAGKIVLCRGGKVGSADKGVAVDKAGGSGVIIVGQEHDGEYVRAIAHLIPGTIVPFAAGKEIIGYVGSTPYPVCKILFFGTLVGGSSPPAPRIATTSSRGPSIPAPGILKPDLIAPGVNILAAWSGVSSPTKLAADTRRVEFNIISGTSMACPHVSGIAALLKKARPSWSPAMIMSALMTTAYGTDNAGDEIGDMATGKAAGPFELGAGHVDPNSALDPGLVYDAGEDDYVDFMCSIKASSPYNCSTRVSITGAELNRPSFSVKFKAYGENITLQRTVRNVGSNVDAVYTVGKRTGFPPGTRLIISPGKLVFDAEHQTRTYTIVFQSTLPPGNFTEYTHGSIVWSDGVHNVRSPIAVTWPFPTAALSVM